MPSDLLYHFLGVHGYQFERILDQHDALVIVISQPRKSYSCPCCGSKRVHAQGAAPRKFRTIPVGQQLGSFIGVWLGGYLYATIGSYDPVWWTGVTWSGILPVRT